MRKKYLNGNLAINFMYQERQYLFTLNVQYSTSLKEYIYFPVK